MKFLRLARKNREVNAESFDRLYESRIISKIRERYSVNQELAILRQRDEKTAEFANYYAFVERCKAEVKNELGLS